MDNNYVYQYNPDTTVMAPVAIGVLLFALFFVALSYAIVAFLTGRVFKKAGVPQWAAWVPIYNYWKLLQLGDQQGFWAILAFVPFLNIVSVIFIYIAMYRIGQKLGKEGWFVLFAIFLPVVWLIWLGYDDSKWARGHNSKSTFSTKSTAKKAPRSKKPVVAKKQ